MPERVSIEEIRQACQRSLHFLCTEMLKYKDWDVVHDDTEKFLARPSMKKALLLPRDHLKTSMVTIGKSIQFILQNPNVRILIANQIWDFARKILSEVKGHFEDKSDLPKVFGRFVSNHWCADSIIVAQRTKSLKEPTIMTTGVEAENTGGHYEKIFLDDLMGHQNCQTPEQREKAKRFRRSMIALLEPGGEIIDIGTRWHNDDTFSEIFEKEMDYYDVMTRQIVENGKLIFPKKFSKKFDRIKKNWVHVDYNCLDYVDHLKASMTSAEFSCTPSETPILMSDWKTKPIEHVKVGDEIIGFTLGQGKKNGALVKTRVKRTFSKTDHVLKLTMESGRTVLCTKDHKWYTGRPSDPTHLPYTAAKIGSKLSFVCPVEQKQLSLTEQMDWSYLAGIFDGEGSTKSGGCLTVSQCQSVNPKVHASIINVFDRLGIKYGSHVRTAEEHYGRNNSEGNTSFWIKDSFNVGLNLIRNTQCAKSSQIADRFFKFGRKFARYQDKVVDVKYDSYRTVYALETETGNYVAWGYASSNSQYMNQPIDEEHQLFKPSYFKYYDRRPERLFVAMTLDPAISEKQSADYFAINVSGMDEHYNIYVLDTLKGHWRVSEQIDNIFTMYEKWHPSVIGLETVAYQKALKAWLEEKMRDRGTHFPITELKRSTNESKEFRIKSMEPFYREGKVFHAKWMKGLEEELMTFPKGKHDDEADALASQLELLVPGDSIAEQGIPEGSWEAALNEAKDAGNRYRSFFHERVGNG